MNKIGRNDKCSCNSGKKYKKCCFNKCQIEKANEREIYNGHEVSSDNVKIIIEWLNKEYYYIKVIDISKYLNQDNYQKFQVRYYYSSLVMVAERNEENEKVFEKRGDKDCNIIMMYQGAYRCFSMKEFMNTDKRDRLHDLIL